MIVSQCPSIDSLSQFASGKLPEDVAASVESHLAGCSQCQEQVDQLLQRDDSLAGALRHEVNEEKVNGEPGLASMIARAQQGYFPGGRPAAAATKSASQASVALDAFTVCLRRSGLFKPGEVDDLLQSAVTEDSETFARHLIEQGRLTPYQAKALLRGRWKGLVLGNYEVLEKLGSGGMGHVFKARHRHMGRIVCVKVLHASAMRSAEMVDRFRREAKMVAALNHPNIVVAHDADEADGIPFLVMEFIQGSDLSRLVKQHGPLPMESAVSMVLQVARALVYAHDRGVVHRDIKPHNLLVDRSGVVKVLDMGLARFDAYMSEHADALTHASMTSTGLIMGTVDYISPEQALNSRHADQRSDIYSLGCTLYFLLTGRALYDGQTVMEKLIAHREQPAPGLSASGRLVPPDLQAIFARMIAKNPDGRYATVKELVADLEAFLAGGTVHAATMFAASTNTRTEPELPVGKSRRTRLWATAAAAVLLLAGGAFLVAQGFMGNAGDPPAPGPEKPKVADADNETQTPPPIVGHPATTANGGAGRALVIVPHRWFYEDQFMRLSESLNQRGIEMVVGSSMPGLAQPKHGKIKAVPVDVTLDQVSVDDFDAVIFVGGNVREFTHKGGKPGERARQVIDECLNRQKFVASIGDGADAIDDTGFSEACKYRNEKGIQVADRIDDRVGAVVRAKESKYADQLVQFIFSALREQRVTSD